MIRKWEYLVKTAYPESLEDTLTLLGDEKWELVNANYSTDKYDLTRIALIFKRPKSLGWKIINPND